ncbi:MAG: hypothetical protein AB1405_11160 [Bdellovibrionota bacterium]
MNEAQTPRPSRRFWLAGFVLLGLGLVALGVRAAVDRDTAGDPCRGVRICDRELFKNSCQSAGSYPDPLSAIAVLGKPSEERCPEGESTCEIEILGGAAPRYDGCILRYEKGSGRILEARWYGW